MYPKHTDKEVEQGLIADGLLPLEDPGEELPGAPEGHYVIAAYCGTEKEKGAHDVHFIKIEGMCEKGVMFSEKSGYCGFFDYNGCKAWVRNRVLTLEELRSFNRDNFWLESRFMGFYAVPDSGINLSTQKIVYDIWSSNPKCIEAVRQPFVEIELEFYNAVKDLPVREFESTDQAESVFESYAKAVMIYSGKWNKMAISAGMQGRAVAEGIVKIWQEMKREQLCKKL